MKIFSIPYTKNNPYLDNLAASLKPHHITMICDVGFDAHVLSILRKVFMQKEVKIVHYHWLDPCIKATGRITTIIKNICFLLEVMIIRLFGKRIVWTVHNLLPHDTEYKKILIYFIRLFVKFTDAIIVHSNYARQLIVNELDADISKIRIIPHGNYINNYKNTVSRDEARKKLYLGNNKFVMLFIGRIRPYKGLLNLVDIVNKSTNENLHLVIAGVFDNDRHSDRLLNKIGNHPRFTVHRGFVPADELQYFMNAADIVVLPYTNILTSGVAILAMSFGKPVIAPSLGELTELFNNNGGILYNPANQEGLSGAIEQASHADLEAMGAYNLSRARSQGWESVAAATKTVYQSCL